MRPWHRGGVGQPRRVDDGVADDAVSIWTVLDLDEEVALLPAWYQPAPMRRSRLLTGWPRRVAIATIVSFVAINAAGLCATYGHVGIG
jgi:hypothetical protein